LTRRYVATAVLGAAVAAAAISAGRTFGPEHRPAAEGYARELAEVSASVRWCDAEAARKQGSALAQTRAASARLERARLTGSYEDYAEADRRVSTAFAAAPPGAGPVMDRARLSFTLHRFDRIEADLATAERAILIDDPSRAEILGLRADLALQRGEVEAARRGFLEALRLHESPQGWSRLARAEWLRGDHDRAAACYGTALRLDHGRRASSRAWIHLQLGLMALEARDYGAALDAYRDADAILPGWWLIEEHIAEVVALQGDRETAARRYRDLIERTGNPEFMDALARIERTRGRRHAATRWIARATKVYEARLGQFPEATWGHALRHYLDFGDPKTALTLAEANCRLRPNAESRALLAEAKQGARRARHGS
jgi:tetratricopeptide (TPR) repeat protein